MISLSKLNIALVSIAVGILSAPSSAQDTVQLYGLIDSGLVYQTIKGSDRFESTKFGISSGMQTTSRWGMKGRESIGNGYYFNFQIEGSFDTNTGAVLSYGRLFGLQSWMGFMKEDLGYLRLGRQSSFAPEFFLPIDPFRGGLGQARMAFAFGSANSNTKYSNMLKLMAQPMTGLRMGAGYSFAPQMPTYYFDGSRVINAGTDYNFETTNNTRLLSLGASYTNGPLMLSATYDQVMPSASGVAGYTGPATNIQEWIVGGKYDFQVLQLSAAIGQNKGGLVNIQGVSVTSTGKAFIDSSAWGGGAGAILFDPNMSFNSYMLGFTVPINSFSKVFSSWTRAASTSNSRAQGGVASQNAYSIGYQYDLSKRTNLYLATSYATNAGFVQGVSSFWVVSGVRHTF
jgi:GBP family porin